MNKNNIIKLSDKQVNDINKNLDIINKSKTFNKKITLSHRLSWRRRDYAGLGMPSAVTIRFCSKC